MPIGFAIITATTRHLLRHATLAKTSDADWRRYVIIGLLPELCYRDTYHWLLSLPLIICHDATFSPRLKYLFTNTMSLRHRLNITSSRIIIITICRRADGHFHRLGSISMMSRHHFDDATTIAQSDCPPFNVWIFHPRASLQQWSTNHILSIIDAVDAD